MSPDNLPDFTSLDSATRAHLIRRGRKLHALAVRRALQTVAHRLAGMVPRRPATPAAPPCSRPHPC
ncbi:hypothetical protein [Roseospirillum parvum]|uniref:Uncharacterized protein n=1 Tax=Roseospirillum parvum TaxID=83401 RepID=A0A1G8ERA4_9PROT|nr:hypothetical protein [Roseospirillum parvum]SDH72420.1 hypothetical protein SAMN05421742_11113 [Roseospirillum parvum]